MNVMTSIVERKHDITFKNCLKFLKLFLTRAVQDKYDVITILIFLFVFLSGLTVHLLIICSDVAQYLYLDHGACLHFRLFCQFSYLIFVTMEKQKNYESVKQNITQLPRSSEEVHHHPFPPTSVSAILKSCHSKEGVPPPRAWVPGVCELFFFPQLSRFGIEPRSYKWHCT